MFVLSDGRRRYAERGQEVLGGGCGPEYVKVLFTWWLEKAVASQRDSEQMTASRGRVFPVVARWACSQGGKEASV